MTADRSSAKTVLVADDDDDLRGTIAEYLVMHGYEVLEASNGLEALLHVKRHRPPVVILDVAMPRLGGLEALKRIAAFDPAIAVIVVSGAVDSEMKRTAAAFGARAVFDKPLDLAALVEAVGLPRATPVQTDKPVAASAAPPAPAAADVLIVDDDGDIREMLEEFVGSLGYSARTEADASGALRAIAERAPAVVLLDIQMPGLLGVDALPAIRALAPGTAVIMVSGVHDADIAKQALSRGAFDYVVKPPDLGYLTQSLQAAMAVSTLDR